jgi:tetratricopeptide (TPR) repeat protein
MSVANWLTVILTMALGSASASAQVISCAGVVDAFAARLALSTGAMDEDGAFALLRGDAEQDLRSCPDLEPQRYYLARMAELGYLATGARRADGPTPGARALAEESQRRHPLSVRIATVAARLDGSVDAARRAMVLDPGYAPARTALAAALAANGDTPAALATLAGADVSQSAAALVVRARIKLLAGDANGALADAVAARNAGQKKELEPTPSRDTLRDTEELLGLSSRALGNPLEARKHLERAAVLGSVKAREALAEIAPSRRQGK